MKEGLCSAPASCRTLQFQPCDPGFRIKDRKKRKREKKALRNFPLKLRKATKAKCVTGVTLDGDLERPLCEAVNVNPGLPWRP